MGHVQKRGDRKYQARWLDGQGRERAKTFTRKADAERHIAAAEGAKLAGTYVDMSGTITVAEYAKQWAATRPHRPLTAARTATLIRTHIEATPLGSRRLVALRPSEVQAWATERSRRLSPSTLRLVVGTLRSVFNAAVRDRLVAHNPVLGLSLPRSERERIVPLTVGQVRALAEAMPARCQAMVIAQAGLGLRIGELMACAPRMSTFCAARCAFRINSASTARLAWTRRRQDHGGPCRCPRWSLTRSPHT